jgi:hypothetical protein
MNVRIYILTQSYLNENNLLFINKTSRFRVVVDKNYEGTNETRKMEKTVCCHTDL